jgi:two-component system sensor histidine kinase PilS (NtrC family)
MRISRRERSTPTVTNLGDWLNGFVREFKAGAGLDDGDIKLRFTKDYIMANMDPDQLYQVMWNICENGIRYSQNKPLIEISCDIHRESQRPYIDIIDTGSGINSEISEHLFEPFITSESKGTGLGLFIARELCETNQATLNLYSNTDEGCIFRINFSHPDRKQGIS